MTLVHTTMSTSTVLWNKSTKLYFLANHPNQPLRAGSFISNTTLFFNNYQNSNGSIYMSVLIICDFPHSNYEVKPFDNKMQFLIDKCPPKGSVSKLLVGKRAASVESLSLGEMTKGKYLNNDHAQKVTDFLSSHKSLIESHNKIICMGSISSKLFTNLTIKNACGRLHEIDNRQIYCTWHPNQIFSSDRIRRDFKSHMVDIQNIIRDKSSLSLKTTTKINISQSDLSELLTSKDINAISVDCETSRHKYVDMVSIDCGLTDDSGQRITHLIDIPNHEFSDKILHGRHLVFQKGTYDIPFLISNCNLDLTKVTWADISYTSRFYEPDQLYGLSEQQKRYAPDWPQWKQFRGK